MKIAFAGKGGVGKTTLCSSIALLLDEMGYKILCIDADPDANLALALGAGEIIPLSKDKTVLQSVIKHEDRSRLEGMFELTLKIDNVIEKFASKWGNTGDILTLGWSKNGGQGCYCTENNALNALIRSVPKEQYDYILIDGEAGLEHLSRGLTSKADHLIIVLQSGQRSIQTAHDAKKLAKDIGIKHTHFILNGYINDDEITYIQEKSNLNITLALNHNINIRKSDLTGNKIYIDDLHKYKIKEFLNEILKKELEKELLC